MTQMTNETPEQIEDPLNGRSRQQVRKEAQLNRKKMQNEIKMLGKPLKVGEFVQYARQYDGALAMIHKFLHEMHGEVYEEFLRVEQEKNKRPTKKEIAQAETEESSEEVKHEIKEEVKADE